MKTLKRLVIGSVIAMILIGMGICISTTVAMKEANERLDKSLEEINLYGEE